MEDPAEACGGEKAVTAMKLELLVRNAGDAVPEVPNGCADSRRPHYGFSENPHTGRSAGHLKVMDSFVTDRSFEEFVKKHSSETNLNLIDSAVRKWLVQEYGLPSGQSNGCNVPRAQKHALTARTCKCGTMIAGNVYFRHLKSCKVAVTLSVCIPNQSRL